MLSLGNELSHFLKPGDVIFFQGELGVGKTTLIRGILKGFGFKGFVKSPSYTLIELYDIATYQFVHVDLYRVEDPRSVLELGLTDYLTSDSILLIEWPKNNFQYLPAPTLWCDIRIADQTRELTLTADEKCLSQLAK